MKTPIPKTAHFIFKKFNFFWVLGTLFLLIIMLLVNWKQSDKRSYNDLQRTSVTLSNNVDGLIEDLFQDVYSLPIYGSEIPDCKTTLFPYLQYITANSSKISGLIISNKNHQVVCSTFPKAASLIAKTVTPRTLSGPYKAALFDQPVYLVQQKMGSYNIGIVVFSSILEKTLQPTVRITDSVSLYDQVKKKNIMSIVLRKNSTGWSFATTSGLQPPISKKRTYVTEPLQSFDDIQVVVYEDPNMRLTYLWVSQIILCIIFLIGSYLVYYLTKKTLTRRYSLHNALKSALKNNEFYPVYQPLFDVDKKKFTGVEVLLRWADNTGETIMPDSFIAETEGSGLIIPITLQMIEESFQELKSVFKEHPDFHMGINLCAAHFLDPYFFNEFYRLADKYNITSHQVLFEITERDLIDKNNTLFNDRMQELRARGHSLAIDDYGTGHASISYLQQFPFDHLKIDKLFVQAIGTKAITESLNDAIIHMAKNLKLHIIAEGVETKEQVNYLAANGVRFLQGWYFSKALTIDKLIELLREKNNGSSL